MVIVCVSGIICVEGEIRGMTYGRGESGVLGGPGKEGRRSRA